MLKKSEGSRFWRVSLLYFLSTFLSKLAVFFLLPLYTAKIPAADMGVFDTATALAILLAATLFFDVGIGVMRAYLSARDGQEQRAVLAAGLVFTVSSLVLYLLLGGLLVAVWRVPHGGLVVLYGAANSLLATTGYFIRAKGQRLCYALVMLGCTLVQVGLNLYFLLVCEAGYEVLYISFAVAALAASLVFLWRSGAFAALGALRTCRTALFSLWRFCLPLGASAAAYLVLTSGARVLTTLCLGSEAGGVMAVAVKLSQVAFVVGAVLRFAWQELCFVRGFDENGAGDSTYYTARVSLLLHAVLAGALLLVPLLRVWLWIFPSFIASDYAVATRLLPVVLLGALLAVVTDFLEPLLAVRGKTGMILLTAALGGAFGCATTLLLFAAGLGVWGAAIGFFTGFFVTALGRLWLCCRSLWRVLCGYWHFLPLALLPLAVYLFLPPASSLLLLCFLLLLPLCQKLLLLLFRALCR